MKPSWIAPPEYPEQSKLVPRQRSIMRQKTRRDLMAPELKVLSVRHDRVSLQPLRTQMLSLPSSHIT